MSNFIGGLIQFVFRIEERRFTVISNKTLSQLEYLHFSFAAWPENQENALTHTYQFLSELKVHKSAIYERLPISIFFKLGHACVPAVG